MARCFCHLHCTRTTACSTASTASRELVEQTKKLGHERRAPSPTTATCTAPSSSTRECKDGGINPIIGYEAYVAPGSRADTKPRQPAATPVLPPHAARQERHRLQEPHQDVVARVPRRLLLHPAHRQGVARSAQRGAHLPERLPRASSASSSSRTSWTEAEKLAEWFAKMFGDELLRRDSEQRPRHPGRSARRRGRTSPTSSACRSWPPPTPTTCAARTPSAHDVLFCINTGRCTTRRRRSTPKSGCRTSSTSAARRRCTSCSRTTPDAVARSQEIADGVRHRARLQEAALPRLRRRPTGRRPKSTCANCARRG